MCQGLNTPAVQEYLLGLRAFSSSLSCDLYKAFFPIHLFLSLLFFSRGLVSFKPPPNYNLLFRHILFFLRISRSLYQVQIQLCIPKALGGTGTVWENGMGFIPGAVLS